MSKQHVNGNIYLETDNGKYYLYLGDNQYTEITNQADIDAANAQLAALETTVANKVDIEAGKGLSTEDYTQQEKATVANVPGNFAAANNRIDNLQSSVNLYTSAIDSKVDKQTGKGLSTNDYTNADKSLVATVPTLQNQIQTANTNIATIQGGIGTVNGATTAQDIAATPAIKDYQVSQTAKDYSTIFGGPAGSLVVTQAMLDNVITQPHIRFINGVWTLDQVKTPDLSNYATKAEINDISAIVNTTGPVTRNINFLAAGTGSFYGGTVGNPYVLTANAVFDYMSLIDCVESEVVTFTGFYATTTSGTLGLFLDSNNNILKIIYASPNPTSGTFTDTAPANTAKLAVHFRTNGGASWPASNAKLSIVNNSGGSKRVVKEEATPVVNTKVAALRTDLDAISSVITAPVPVTRNLNFTAAGTGSFYGGTVGSPYVLTANAVFDYMSLIDCVEAEVVTFTGFYATTTSGTLGLFLDANNNILKIIFASPNPTSGVFTDTAPANTAKLAVHFRTNGGASWPESNAKISILNNNAQGLKRVVNDDATPFVDAKIATINAKLAEAKKEVGVVVNPTLNATASSLYTDVSPQTVFTFTANGITATGGNNDSLNYLAYTSYYSNALKHRASITFTATADGNGIAVGSTSQNAITHLLFIMTGAEKGKISIRTGTVQRAISLSALSYNAGDKIQIILTKSMFFYAGVAMISGIPSSAIYVSFKDPALNGEPLIASRSFNPTIFHYGGSQTITAHTYEVLEETNVELVITGDSLTGAGAYAGNTTSGVNDPKGASNCYAFLLKKAIPDGVSIIAGGGNRSSDIINLLPEVYSINSRSAMLSIGVNDISSNITKEVLLTNIKTFITGCYQRNILPIVLTIPPVGPTRTGTSQTAAQLRANIIAANNDIKALTTAYVIDIFPALSAGAATTDSLNSIYDSGDGLHWNREGHKLVFDTISLAISSYLL